MTTPKPAPSRRDLLEDLEVPPAEPLAEGAVEDPAAAAIWQEELDLRRFEHGPDLGDEQLLTGVAEEPLEAPRAEDDDESPLELPEPAPSLHELPPADERPLAWLEGQDEHASWFGGQGGEGDEDDGGAEGAEGLEHAPAASEAWDELRGDDEELPLALWTSSSLPPWASEQVRLLPPDADLPPPARPPVFALGEGELAVGHTLDGRRLTVRDDEQGAQLWLDGQPLPVRVPQAPLCGVLPFGGRYAFCVEGEGLWLDEAMSPHTESLRAWASHAGGVWLLLGEGSGQRLAQWPLDGELRCVAELPTPMAALAVHDGALWLWPVDGSAPWRVRAG